jgi:ribosomal protein S27AE
MNSSTEKTCPRCGSAMMKNWGDLTEEQQMLARKLPLSAEYSHAARKRHRFCTRCWFEETEKRNSTA